MDSDVGLFAWWMERPWWLRWLLALIPLGVAIGLLVGTDSFFPWWWAIGALMFLANLFLSWGEILDRFMPRR